MNVGEEKDLNVTFPEDYGAAELAGAPVVFKVKVNEIKADVVPEIDDEFAKDVSEFETLEELKADLRAKVEKRKTDAAQSAFETAVMDKAIANAEMEVPDTMVEYELDRQMQNFEQRIAGYGMKLDQYLSMMGTNRKEFAENQRPGALRSIQQDLLLEAVVKAENIEASQEEKDAEVKRLSEEFGMEEDKVRAAVSEEQLAYGVQVQKASNVIVESAVAVAP
jgi:trigger factor